MTMSRWIFMQVDVGVELKTHEFEVYVRQWKILFLVKMLLD